MLYSKREEKVQSGISRHLHVMDPENKPRKHKASPIGLLLQSNHPILKSITIQLQSKDGDNVR